MYLAADRMETQTAELIRFDEACQQKPAINWDAFMPANPHFVGVDRLDVSQPAIIRTYLDWRGFFHKWESPISFPDVLEHPEVGEAARKFFGEINTYVDTLLAEGVFEPQAIFGVWQAYADEQNVVVLPDNQESVMLCFLRQQTTNESGVYRCLADYIKPKSALRAGKSDYVGGYALTLGRGVAEKLRQLEAENDTYHAYLLQDISELYLTAMAEYLHYKVRRERWAYCDDDDLSNEEVIDELYQGIRTEIGKAECPDISEREKLFDLLAIDRNRFSIEDVVDYNPLWTMSGYLFAHPKSRNFEISGISNDQLAIYAQQKGMSSSEIEARLTIW